MQNEESTLNNHPGDFMLPADPFRTAVGHFWGMFNTRPYMRARFALVSEMQRVVNVESVQAQLDHVMDMLRLCGSDNLGMRYWAPGLMLRLGMDQECYDFVKWWAAMQNSHYDSGNLDLPYLDIKGADFLNDPIDCFCSRFFGLHHGVAVTLLKIRLVLHLAALDKTSAIAAKIPQEVLDQVQPSTVMHSPVIVADKEKITNKQLRVAAIDKLRKQVGILFNTVNKANKYSWPALLSPEGHLTARPEMCARGTVEEMQDALGLAYAAWSETPGAIEFIKAKLQGKV